MRTLRRLALLLALAWGGDAAAAGGTCTLLAPLSGSTFLDFGLYKSLGAAVDRTGSLTLVCVPVLPALTVTYRIEIDAGGGNAGSFSPRRMTAGGYGLGYNLFRDASRTLIWGNGTGGTSAHTGICATTCVLTVYGRLFGGQSAPAGAYSDTVTLTLDF
jgi:spore coat protein U-like protein